MDYREFRPRGALGELVECVWTLDVPASAASEPQTILPDGCVEWIAHLGDAPLEHGADGVLREQTRAFVVGPQQRALRITPRGALRCVGIRFQPAGAARALGTNASELAGRTVDAHALDGRFARALTARLDPDADASVWAAAAECALTERFGASSAPDPLAHAATRAIVSARGQLSIETLADSLGKSRRQLERVFEREVGLAPKVLARILRFQHAYGLAQTDTPQSDAPQWAEVAARAGYADQAHLIRDFRAFAGTTPASLCASAAALTETFSRAARTG